MENKLMLTEQSAIMPLMDIQTAVQRFSQVAEFVKEIMKSGTDYGTIPGTGDKPTLLKPGAEKLTTFFGLSKRFEIIEKIEDWTGKDHSNEPFFYYLYRCGLYRNDNLIAEADGSCNSFEAKYRWRKAERTCPNCGIKPNTAEDEKPLTPEQLAEKVYEKYQDAVFPDVVDMRKFIKIITEALTANTAEDEPDHRCNMKWKPMRFYHQCTVCGRRDGEPT